MVDGRKIAGDMYRSGVACIYQAAGTGGWGNTHFDG